MVRITEEIFGIVKQLNKINYQELKNNNNVLNNISKKLKRIYEINKYKTNDSSIERRENSIYELNCLCDYVCESEDVDNTFTDFLRNMALLADVANNLAHSSKYPDISDALYSLKSNIVNVMHKEIKNNKTLDIIDGFKTDIIKAERIKSYVIDIPGNGQLSWHLKRDIPTELLQDIDKTYPYAISKTGEFYNHNLLLSLIANKNLTQHDYLVANNEVGTENELREVLNVYYSNSYLMESDENRDKKCRAIGIKTGLSKANIDNLANVLNVSKKQVYEYREEYIHKEQEK